MRDKTHTKIAAVVLFGLLATGTAVPAMAAAPTKAYAIPAGDLANALHQFARESQVSIAFPPGLTKGLSTAGLKGQYTPEAGLAQLLSGHGLQLVKKQGAFGIRPAHQDGGSEAAAALGDIVVIGQRINGPGNSIRLDKEAVERFRGTSNGDVFQGIASVQVNSVRNEAGALDVGVRSIQGEGRVPVYIDGSLQSTHTFRGYQGESDRTYVDMDLISQVTTDKGASASKYGTGAIGGVIQMKTLGVEDILLPGERFGVLLKGSLFNNNKSPSVSDDEREQGRYVLTDALKGRRFDNGAFTAGFAYQDDGFDFMAAYNHRKVGNYFAGKKGIDRYNPDHAIVSPGQEVVNTSYESDSGVAKLGINLDESQRLELNFRRHLQKAGEVMSFYWHKGEGEDEAGNRVDTMPQWSLGTARVSAYSVDYKYQPVDNPLVDLDVSLWQTRAKMHQHNGFISGIGNYGDQYLTSFADDRWGVNVDNKSRLASLPLTLNYGFTLDEQKTQPRNLYEREIARHAKRKEQSVFLSMNYTGAWADLNLTSRLHKSSIDDHIAQAKYAYHTKFDWLGHAAIHLNEAVDLYGKLSSTYRNPSLFEGSTSGQTYSYDKNHPIRPENARSWELGFTGKDKGLWHADDRFTFRANYFNNNIKDYLTAGSQPSGPDAPSWETYSLTFVNYNRLLLRGVEINFAYDHPSFFIEANATQYKSPKICPEHANECDAVGGSWSLISSRIAPKRVLNLSVGKYFMDRDLSLGMRLRYHSGKSNPKGWLSGTGISGRAVEEIPSEKVIDLFAKYTVNKHAEVTFNVDNLTNRYTFDPGTVIGMPMPGRTVKMGLSMKF